MRRHSPAQGLGTGRAQERHPALERWSGERRDIRGYVNYLAILPKCQSVKTGAVWKNGDLVLLKENISPEVTAEKKKIKAEFIKSDFWINTGRQ